MSTSMVNNNEARPGSAHIDRLRSALDEIRRSRKPDGAELLGEGEVGLQDVADALQKIGYGGWITFATTPTDDPMNAIAHNFSTLRTFI